MKVLNSGSDGALSKQEFFYVAAHTPEEAKKIMHNALAVSEDAVVILSPLLHETIEGLGISHGQFVAAARQKGPVR